MDDFRQRNTSQGVSREKFQQKGGEMQMVQLWVNLPAKDKMTEPKYQNIENKDLAKVDLGNGIGSIDIIAGEFEKNKGPASSFTPLSLFNVKLNKGKGTSLSFNESHNTGLLIIKGNVTINNKQKAPTNHFVLFENKGKEFTCLLYTSPSPRDRQKSRMPSSA